MKRERLKEKVRRTKEKARDKKAENVEHNTTILTIVCVEKGDQIIRSNKSNKTKTENENKKSSFF